MIIELYEALKVAGVPDDKAKEAAKAVEEVRESERLRAIEERLTRIEGKFQLYLKRSQFEILKKSRVS